MKTRTLAMAVTMTVGALVVFSGCQRLYRGQYTTVDTTTVTLQMTNGACHATASPDRLVQKTKERLTFHITNVDCGALFVGVTNFRPERSGGGYGTADPDLIKPKDPAVTASAVAPGETRDITATLKRIWFAHDTFKYSIMGGPSAMALTTTLGDPDVDVWPTF